MFAFETDLSLRNKKKKNEALLTHHLLSTELKMRTKDVESAMTIQSSGQTFLQILEELTMMATNPIDTLTSSSSSSSSSTTLGKRSPTGSSSSSDKVVDEGPSHRGLSRLRLGLAIRGAGALYTQAILYAASQLLIRTLLDASDGVGERQEPSGLDRSARLDDAGNCDAVVDALMHACELPKMMNVIEQHRNRFPHNEEVVMKGCETGSDNAPLPSFVATAESVHTLMLRIGMDPQQSHGQGQGSENDYHRRIHQLLLACNTLAEAIDVLGLDQVYNMAPLLSGHPPCQ